jgi:hypothetical protein
MVFSADFETTTTLDDCRVWAWGICEVSKNPCEYHMGNDINGFMKWCFEQKNPCLYFHNAKFDTDFIINWLFRNGFEWVESTKGMLDGQFTTLISDDGKFYTMHICSEIVPKRNIIEIRDSQKLLNMSVAKIAKTFKLPNIKLEIDYNEFREIGHELTSEEKEYLKADITIVSKALAYLFESGTTRLTIGSNALNKYYEMVGGRKQFRKIFPKLDVIVDKDIRAAYKGGFTYLNPIYKEVDIGEGLVFDVNSLYPWAMHSPNVLPYGRPVFFSGQYQEDKMHPLYIQRLRCQFELKPNKIPMIQLKHNLSFVPTEYLKSSNNQIITLTLTNIDLQLFLENYEVYEMEYVNGWKFKGASGMFDQYIDYWTDIKIQATKDKNAGLRAIAKLYLNSLYGKFATSPYVRSAIPYLGEDGVVHYHKTEYEERDSIYVPIGAFITAIARNKTIRSAQSVYDRYLYSDTDSIHIKGTDIPDCLEVDDYMLGAWKCESKFDRARFIRQKCYIEDEIITEEEYNSKMLEFPYLCRKTENGYRFMKVTVAGLPAGGYKYVTWDNFRGGAKYGGKLQPKRVAGGTVLNPTTYEIKVS